MTIGEATDAIVDLAGELVREIDQIPDYADELAAALANGGDPALRESLRRVGLEVSGKIDAAVAAARSRLAGALDADAQRGPPGGDRGRPQ